MITIRKPEDANGSGEPAGPPPDIFDNLAALRLEADAGALVGAVEVLAHVPIRKPSPTEWVRVHPDADMTLATSFYVDRENRETYLVVPEMREVLITGVKIMLLVTAVTSRGSVFLWPLALGDDTGRTNAWHETARDGATRAKSAWTKIAADMSAGHYRIFQAEGNLPEPVWPIRARCGARLIPRGRQRGDDGMLQVGAIKRAVVGSSSVNGASRKGAAAS